MPVAAPAVENTFRARPAHPAGFGAPLGAEDIPNGASTQSGAASGRLRDANVSDSDRTMAVFIHVSPFAFMLGLGPLSVLLPVILWIVRKDQSVFHDDHGREVINFGLSFIVLHVLLAITFVGVLLMPVLWIVAAVNLVRGAVAAGRGEYFRYPVTIRFLS